MVLRLSKIITKRGDSGETLIGGGVKVSKDDPRVIAIGSIDELSSNIGLLRQYVADPKYQNDLIRIQHHLFIAGSFFAGSKKSVFKEEHILFLETLAEDLINQFEPSPDFLLPGGSMAGAHCHICRTVCRRVECCFVACKNKTERAALPARYLNRLSDVLFLMARVFNKQENVTEIVLQRDIV